MASEFTLGAERSFVTLRIHSRQFPELRDSEDGNWLQVSAVVRAGGMTAEVQAEFVRAEELSEFLSDLQEIYERIEGDAHFSTMEGWLDVKVLCNPNGSLIVKGEVLDRHGVGNRLLFSLPDLDQTHLPPLIADLQRTVDAFPIVGRH